MLPLWRSIFQAFSAQGQKWGLPGQAGMVLVHLHVHPENGEPAILAQAMYFPRQTMTFVLDALESRDLARRIPHPADRRRKRIELTEAGREQAARMLADLLAFEAVALSAIPEESLGLFRRLVECYAATLASQNNSSPDAPEGPPA